MKTISCCNLINVFFLGMAQLFNSSLLAQPGLLTSAVAFNKSLDLFYIYVGEQDNRIEPTKQLVGTFRQNGLDVAFATYPGTHEWQVWRLSLYDFLPRLFR